MRLFLSNDSFKYFFKLSMPRHSSKAQRWKPSCCKTFLNALNRKVTSLFLVTPGAEHIEHVQFESRLSCWISSSVVKKIVKHRWPPSTRSYITWFEPLGSAPGKGSQQLHSQVSGASVVKNPHQLPTFHKQITSNMTIGWNVFVASIRTKL